MEPHFEESVQGCFVRFHGSPSANAAQNRDEYLLLEVMECRTKEDIIPYKYPIHHVDLDSPNSHLMQIWPRE